jgi:6-phosphogluconolactonase/glucosamine-6-phosphate isomerase/deaminase
MGDNGHTASLFPGLTAVHERSRWVVAEYVAEVSMWRVTLTPPVIDAAADVVFLVSGSGKAAMLHRVLEGPRRPDALPVQAIVPNGGCTLVCRCRCGDRAGCRKEASRRRCSSRPRYGYCGQKTRA